VNIAIIIFCLGFISGALVGGLLVSSSIRHRIEDIGSVSFGPNEYILMRSDLSPRRLKKVNRSYFDALEQIADKERHNG
jgi:hypothetical protein